MSSVLEEQEFKGGLLTQLFYSSVLNVSTSKVLHLLFLGKFIFAVTEEMPSNSATVGYTIVNPCSCFFCAHMENGLLSVSFEGCGVAICGRDQR